MNELQWVTFFIKFRLNNTTFKGLWWMEGKAFLTLDLSLCAWLAWVYVLCARPSLSLSCACARKVETQSGNRRAIIWIVYCHFQCGTDHQRGRVAIDCQETDCLFPLQSVRLKVFFESVTRLHLSADMLGHEEFMRAPLPASWLPIVEGMGLIIHHCPRPRDGDVVGGASAFILGLDLVYRDECRVSKNR